MTPAGPAFPPGSWLPIHLSFTVGDGNEAVALVAHRTNEVIAIYPITPSFTMGELTGGIHTAHDTIKAVIAGADAVQMVSALLNNGPEWLKLVREGFQYWRGWNGNTNQSTRFGAA